ncbi:MAG: tyrosine-type recombinase/integrase [Methylobacter sp.]
MRFTTPDGRRVQQSARTTDKQAAQELHDRLKAEAWRVQTLKEKPAYLWQEAVKKWLVEQAEKASIEDDKKHLRWVHPFLFDQKLSEISKDMLDRIKDAKKETGVTNATVNRLLAVIRAILNRAHKEWEWIDNVPYVRLLPEPKKRIRWLSQEEAIRLIRELPPHIAEMVRFTLSTGLRERNVTQLQWNQLDMQRRCAWIHADQAKARKSIAVPLNDEALAVIRRQIGKHETHVFSYKGKPILNANTKAWRHALERAGIEDFRWHDLRHTWASWHVQNGTPLNILQELGGWSEPTMVQRYAHLSPGHLAGYADNAKIGTNLVQAIKKA